MRSVVAAFFFFLASVSASAQTVGDLLAVGPTQFQVQDASGACASAGYCTMPINLFFSRNTLNFGSGAGTVNGPNNNLIWANGGLTNSNLIQAVGVCAASPGAYCSLTSFNFTDNVDMGTAGNYGYGMYFQLVPQVNSRGGRSTMGLTMNVQGSSTFNPQFAAINMYSKASANVGGISSGSTQGALFSINPYCSFLNGATFWQACVGEEIDLNLGVGASAREMIGSQVVQLATSIVLPFQYTVGYVITNQAPGQFTGSISGTTLTVTVIGGNFLQVGDIITNVNNGAGSITPGTKITGLGTGTGGLGTYSLNNSQSVSSTPMLAATTGFDSFLQDGSFAGVPAIAWNGSLFRCFPHGGGASCGTIAYGLDFGAYQTISSFILRGPGAYSGGPGANGFIDGNFNVSATTVSANSFTPNSGTVPTGGLYGTTVPCIASSSAQVACFSSTNNGYVGINSLSPLNAGDMLASNGSANGTDGRSVTFRNANSGAAAQMTLFMGNSNATSQAGLRLNGGGFSGGQGANALQIFNTSTAPIVIGTGTEVIKFGGSGAFTANGTSSAVTITAVTPSGVTSTTIAKWLTITDNAGNVDYIPVWH